VFAEFCAACWAANIPRDALEKAVRSNYESHYPEDVSLTEEIELTNLDYATNPTETDWPKPPPAPSFQVLVELHGGYDRIPAIAFAAHDEAMAKWRLDCRDYYERIRTNKRKPNPAR
jgi:hypothetical protein